jgi:hypothetical protein
MALADQHGGPLKTEFGFATGRASHPSTSDIAGAAPAPPVLRLAPMGGAPEPVSTPAAPAVQREGPVHPVVPVAPATNEETLATAGEELAAARATEAALRAQNNAVSAARAAPEHALGTSRDELTSVIAVAAELREQLDTERAANERAAIAADTLTAQIEDLRGRQAADSAAISTAEDALAAARNELGTALADAETLRARLATTRAAHERAVTDADALRDRVTALETAPRDTPPLVVAPVHGDVEELRAVIELQEQALAAAAARERARDGDARLVVEPSSARSYSTGRHFLFAPSAEGYELLERSGPPPSPGELVELSGGRRCHVLRVGPAPFPGAPEACAYLEPV